jgi:hypothetical protein
MNKPLPKMLETTVIIVSVLMIVVSMSFVPAIVDEWKLLINASTVSWQLSSMLKLPYEYSELILAYATTYAAIVTYLDILFAIAAVVMLYALNKSNKMTPREHKAYTTYWKKYWKEQESENRVAKTTKPTAFTNLVDSFIETPKK